MATPAPDTRRLEEEETPWFAEEVVDGVTVVPNCVGCSDTEVRLPHYGHAHTIC